MPLEVYYRVDVNLIAFVILGIYTWFSYKRLDLTDKLNRLFVFVSLVVLLQLLIEAATVMINRVDIQWFIPLSYFLHVVLFSIGSFIGYLWFYFLLYFVLRANEIKRFVHWIAGVLLGVALFTSLLSPITGWIFTVTTDNVYVRGPLFIYQMTITYLFLFSAIICLFVYRKRLIKEDRNVLFIFSILPILAGSIQVFIYGVLLIWSGIAFTLVIGYIFLRERTTQVDFLTQAITRESFMRYMQRRTLRGTNDIFGMAFLDMNGLKEINDDYGHAEGDYALQAIVRIIKKHISEKEWVVRMGGDEFLIVINTAAKSDLKERMNNIEKSLDEHNRLSSKPYSLKISYGADLYDSKLHELDVFIRRIDHEMYEAKKQTKNKNPIT
jgi:diguanylate cyclase (GGDEF)-like protein